MEKSRKRSRSVSRRDFLDYLLGGSFLITILGIFLAIVRFIWPPHRLVGIQYTDRLFVANLDDFLPGTAIRKVFNGRGILIVRTNSGFTAVDIKCTHQRCNVRWDSQRRVFVCPCHGGLFDAYGNVISGPPPRPLKRVGVKVLGNSVYLFSEGV